MNTKKVKKKKRELKSNERLQNKYVQKKKQ